MLIWPFGTNFHSRRCIWKFCLGLNVLNHPTVLIHGWKRTGGLLSQRPVTRSFDVFFDLRLNKRLRKQSRRWWFDTSSHSLWRHCNDTVLSPQWAFNLTPPYRFLMGVRTLAIKIRRSHDGIILTIRFHMSGKCSICSNATLVPLPRAADDGHLCIIHYLNTEFVHRLPVFWFITHIHITLKDNNSIYHQHYQTVCCNINPTWYLHLLKGDDRLSCSKKTYRQVSNISCTLNRQFICWSLRCSLSIAWRRCSNYIFISFST